MSLRQTNVYIQSTVRQQVHVLTVEKRVNEILNRLNKTRVERRPDLKGTYTHTQASDLHFVCTCSTPYACMHVQLGFHSLICKCVCVCSRERCIKCSGEGREEDAAERQGTQRMHAS